MIKLKLSGTQSEIQDKINALCPFASVVVNRVAMDIPYTNSQEVLRYQAAILYLLATQYNRPGADILEIGTFHGFTAAVMAHAAPEARLITLDCNEEHVDISRENLASYKNVEVGHSFSQDYPPWNIDMLFIDGDHLNASVVSSDLERWHSLKPGGLMIVHDVSITSKIKFDVVVDGVLDFMAAHQIGRPDVAVVDGGTRGMIGFYKREH